MSSHLPSVPSLFWFVLLLAGAAAYAMAARMLRRRGRSWSRWRTASFLSGIGMLAAGILPPLATAAHHDLAIHMLQHLLMAMVAPVGLVLGRPLTLLLRTVPQKAGRRVAKFLRIPLLRFLAHPVTAFCLNIGGMYLFYLTPLYNAAMADPFLHEIVLVHFVAAGSLFVWSIAGDDPGAPRANFRVRFLVLFFSIALHGILAKAMYAFHFPASTHHGAEEIEIAAQIMFYGGDLAELPLLLLLFRELYRRDFRARPRFGIDPSKPISQSA